MPSFEDDVHDYLFNHNDGKRMWGNAVGGARDALYDRHAADALIAKTTAAAAAYQTADRRENQETFIQVFVGSRFQEIPAMRPTIRVDDIPMASQDTPNLTGQFLYSVTTMKALRRAMSDEDVVRLATKSIVIKPDGTVADERAFLDALALLTAPEMSFVLPPNEGLGRFILWFTTEACFREAETRCSVVSDPLSLAESLRSHNGLGHRKPGEWLVLLKIPGAVVQRAGHYRPVFCDGGVGEYSWFMSRSSDETRFDAGPWGQCCDLEQLQSGGATYDGAVERVAIQPRLEHLDGERVEFQILGRVDALFGNSAAMKRLTDGIWARKDL